MQSSRWHKVINDLWGNKTRTLLVVLSIAVGVFAVGMIAGSGAMGMGRLLGAMHHGLPACTGVALTGRFGLAAKCWDGSNPALYVGVIEALERLPAPVHVPHREGRHLTPRAGTSAA